MKKSYVIFLLFSILLICSSNCKGNFSVTPRELSIKMEDYFISGNSSKKIIVTNQIEESINISWYLDNPSQDLIRENKTLIPSLTWISIEPEWKTIPPNGSTFFYIYIDIPEDKDNYNQHWELWPVFKQEETEFFNWEHAVRLYIDTPEIVPDDEKKEQNLFSIFSENILIIFFFVIIFTAAIVSLFFLKIKKRKS
ncbi:hypothetical protein AYK21_04830 [Thermoplasmatales archaeon SG8-52-2]|nr:MAG: hypothetical protein AYK21_04830 [Thermoplasmatales archaeon SG8-52-2]